MLPMLIKRISLFLTFLTLLMASGYAQHNPYGLANIRNYHYTQTGGSAQNWCITQDHRGVIYVGNNDSGILEFDGRTWRTIPVPDSVIVRSLVTGDDGVVYAGLDGDFGKLEPDQSGSLKYRSLKDSLLEKSYPDVIIWKTYYQESKVYFCGGEAIFVYDPINQLSSVITTPEVAYLSYFVNYELYISDLRQGLMKYTGDEFVVIPGGGFFKDKNISGLLPMGPAQFLVSTYFHGLYLLNLENGTIDSTFVNPTLMEELKTIIAVNLCRDERYIYVGTKDKGLIVLDTLGEVSEIISVDQGLLDNTIAQVHISTDGTSSLWVAHWNGVSRLDLNNPFRMQSIGPSSFGMDRRGSGQAITDMVEFNGELFVSTLGGVRHRSYRSQRPGFRPLRDIQDEILDLQVVQPSSGRFFLLASGIKNTYVVDQNLRVQTLSVGGRRILYDPDHPAIFYTGVSDFTGFQYINGEWIEFLKVELNEEIYSLCWDKNSYVWISSWRGLYRLNLAKGQDMELTSFDGEQGLPEEFEFKVFEDPMSQGILLGSSNGFYHFDYLNNTFVPDSAYNSILPEGKNSIMTLHKGANDLYWFSFENEFRGWSMLGARMTPAGLSLEYDRSLRALFSRESTDVFYTDSEGQLWFSKSNQVIHFDVNLAKEEADSFEVLMRKVSILGDSVLFNGAYFLMDPSGQIHPQDQQSEEYQPNLKHSYRDVEFAWSVPYYNNEFEIRYSYFLEGFSSQWSAWTRDNSVKINNLEHGKYVMKVKARNAYEEESPATDFAFSILRPWYGTIVAILIYFILLGTLIVFVILYTRNLKSKAEILEKQNREIELQKKKLVNLNEEVTAQRDEIEAQRDSISDQKELIDRQNMAMTDSIHYARRIQDAVLPAKEVMRYLLPKHFVFYRPRDIVSGDFFWVDKRDETILIAVADCTGHGVPGAFMSMLGISLLNEISSKYRDHSTSEIMDELRDQLITALGQTGDKYEARDGIEMGLVAINTKTREIQFTGANHHLYTFQNGDMVIIKGDPMPVGIHSAGNTLFSIHSLKLHRGDTLYLFSDGYADQFGGEHRKKFGSSRLKKLLSQEQQSIMHDQKESIKKEFDNWKGDQEQIDDVLMIGIKL